MIVESLISFFCGFLDLVLGGITAFVTLPVNLVQTLGTIVAYGSWVIGSDLLVIFAGCVLSWCMVKLTLGVVLFIWRLLPLT